VLPGAEIDLARILLRRVHQILERPVGRLVRHREQHLEACRDRDRSEVREHIVGQLLEQRHADRLAIAHFAERVTVGASAHHLRHVDDAPGARTILDHELLLELLPELVREQPHGEVADPAGTVRHEHPDRLLRVAGGLPACGRDRADDGRRAHEGRRERMMKTPDGGAFAHLRAHRVSPWTVPLIRRSALLRRGVVILRPSPAQACHRPGANANRNAAHGHKI